MTTGRWVMLQSRVRRGAAMLLALAALAIVVPAGVAALRGASNRAVESSTSLDEERARLAALSIGPALLAWAANQDNSEAAAQDREGLRRILDRDGQDGARLIVDAIDLSGRLHVDALGTLARNGLPRPFDQLAVPKSNRAADSSSLKALPLMPEAIAWTVRHELGASASSFPLSGTGSGDHPEPIVALWITGHGRQQNNGARARPGLAPPTPAINIHTAPIELLRAALVGYDPALSRSALECRERGEPIPPEVADSLTAASSAAARGAGERGRTWSLTPLTTRSDAYGFLVAAERGAGRATWWIVAERSMQAGRRGGVASAGRGPVTGWTITERRRVYP